MVNRFVPRRANQPTRSQSIRTISQRPQQQPTQPTPQQPQQTPQPQSELELLQQQRNNALSTYQNYQAIDGDFWSQYEKSRLKQKYIEANDRVQEYRGQETSKQRERRQEGKADVITTTINGVKYKGNEKYINEKIRLLGGNTKGSYEEIRFISDPEANIKAKAKEYAKASPTERKALLQSYIKDYGNSYATAIVETASESKGYIPSGGVFINSKTREKEMLQDEERRRRGLDYRGQPLFSAEDPKVLEDRNKKLQDQRDAYLLQTTIRGPLTERQANNLNRAIEIRAGQLKDLGYRLDEARNQLKKELAFYTSPFKTAIQKDAKIREAITNANIQPRDLLRNGKNVVILPPKFLANFGVEIGKGLFQIAKSTGKSLQFATVSSYNYGKSLVKRGLWSRTNNPLLNDIKKLANGTIEIAKFVRDHPAEASMIVSIGLFNAESRALNLVRTNPERALAEAIFMLTPVKIPQVRWLAVTKSLAKGGIRTALELNLYRVNLNNRIDALRSLPNLTRQGFQKLKELQSIQNDFKKGIVPSKKIEAEAKLNKKLKPISKMTKEEIEAEMFKYTTNQNPNRGVKEALQSQGFSQTRSDVNKEIERLNKVLILNREGKIRIKSNDRDRITSKIRSLNSFLNQSEKLRGVPRNIPKLPKDNFNIIIKPFQIGKDKFTNVISLEKIAPDKKGIVKGTLKESTDLTQINRNKLSSKIQNFLNYEKKRNDYFLFVSNQVKEALTFSKQRPSKEFISSLLTQPRSRELLEKRIKRTDYYINQIKIRLKELQDVLSTIKSSSRPAQRLKTLIGDYKASLYSLDQHKKTLFNIKPKNVYTMAQEKNLLSKVESFKEAKIILKGNKYAIQQIKKTTDKPIVKDSIRYEGENFKGLAIRTTWGDIFIDLEWKRPTGSLLSDKKGRLSNQFIPKVKVSFRRQRGIEVIQNPRLKSNIERQFQNRINNGKIYGYANKVWNRTQKIDKSYIPIRRKLKTNRQKQQFDLAIKPIQKQMRIHMLSLDKLMLRSLAVSMIFLLEKDTARTQEQAKAITQDYMKINAQISQTAQKYEQIIDNIKTLKIETPKTPTRGLPPRRPTPPKRPIKPQPPRKPPQKPKPPKRPEEPWKPPKIPEISLRLPPISQQHRKIIKSKLGKLTFVFADPKTNAVNKLSIKTGLPYLEAKQIGIDVVDNLILASYTITPYGETKKMPSITKLTNEYKFRQKKSRSSRVQEIVEKAKYRLDKVTETQSLSRSRLKNVVEDRIAQIYKILRSYKK